MTLSGQGVRTVSISVLVSGRLRREGDCGLRSFELRRRTKPHRGAHLIDDCDHIRVGIRIPLTAFDCVPVKSSMDGLFICQCAIDQHRQQGLSAKAERLDAIGWVRGVPNLDDSIGHLDRVDGRPECFQERLAGCFE